MIELSFAGSSLRVQIQTNEERETCTEWQERDTEDRRDVKEDLAVHS